MQRHAEKRSDRKHRQIMKAATAVFVAKGYDGTSMDEIAAKASVSKQTIYKHFSDKDHLFSEIVLATTQQVDHVVGLVANALKDTKDLAQDLGRLGRTFLDVLMDEELLQVRRLVIANADRMPSLGRDWYEQGFGRVLAMLASCFRTLAEKKLLQIEDPLIAANHFAGLLLWIPVNEAMFTGNNRPRTKAELDILATAAVRTFLVVYGERPSASLANTRTRRDQPSQLPR
ncbi:MAG: TetR/AcrR family transcriptional regulator [Xanthobacteraceae bacterium]